MTLENDPCPWELHLSKLDEGKEIYLCPLLPQGTNETNYYGIDTFLNQLESPDGLIILVLVKGANERDVICTRTMVNTQSILTSSTTKFDIQKFGNVLLGHSQFGWNVQITRTDSNTSNSETMEEVPAEQIHLHMWELVGNKKVHFVTCEMEKVNLTTAEILSAQTARIYLEGERMKTMSNKMMKEENQKLIQTLKDLTIEKNKMEDRMYRAFTKLLNAKKKRIRQLESELKAAKDPIHSSSGESCYENDTDVESDDGMVGNFKRPETNLDSAISSAKNSENETTPPSKIVDNCKSENISSQSKPTKSSRSHIRKKVPSFLACMSSDSEDDDSQEIVPAKKYVVKSAVNFKSSSPVKSPAKLLCSYKSNEDIQIPGPSSKMNLRKSTGKSAKQNEIRSEKKAPEEPISYDAEDLLKEF